MSATAIDRIKDELESVRHRAQLARRSSKDELTELLITGGSALVAGGVGNLEGRGKLPETFEAFGYNVPTKVSIALGMQVAALVTKGTTRKLANDGARMFLQLAAYNAGRTSGSEAAAAK